MFLLSGILAFGLLVYLFLALLLISKVWESLPHGLAIVSDSGLSTQI